MSEIIDYDLVVRKREYRGDVVVKSKRIPRTSFSRPWMSLTARPIIKFIRTILASMTKARNTTLLVAVRKELPFFSSENRSPYSYSPIIITTVFTTALQELRNWSFPWNKTAKLNANPTIRQTNARRT